MEDGNPNQPKNREKDTKLSKTTKRKMKFLKREEKRK